MLLYIFKCMTFSMSKCVYLGIVKVQRTKHIQWSRTNSCLRWTVGWVWPKTLNTILHKTDVLRNPPWNDLTISLFNRCMIITCVTHKVSQIFRNVWNSFHAWRHLDHCDYFAVTICVLPTWDTKMSLSVYLCFYSWTEIKILSRGANWAIYALI